MGEKYKDGIKPGWDHFLPLRDILKSKKPICQQTIFNTCILPTCMDNVWCTTKLGSYQEHIKKTKSDIDKIGEK